MISVAAAEGTRAQVIGATAGPANLNVVDLATADSSKGGAGGILSITDKYALVPEPASGIAAVLLVGAAARKRRRMGANGTSDLGRKA